MEAKGVILSCVLLSCIGSQQHRPSKASRTQRLPDLYWNTTNHIFRIDNTDHIIDVNQGTLPHEYDQINIICPVYSTAVPEQDTEKYVIYNVNKEEYDTCRIMSSNPRIVAYCTEPYIERFFTISFRSFSPMPNTLEFKAGQDYYFISTSTKQDIHRRMHGDCRDHNMKVVFKVGGSTASDNWKKYPVFSSPPPPPPPASKIPPYTHIGRPTEDIVEPFVALSNKNAVYGSQLIAENASGNDPKHADGKRGGEAFASSSRRFLAGGNGDLGTPAAASDYGERQHEQPQHHDSLVKRLRERMTMEAALRNQACSHRFHIFNRLGIFLALLIFLL